LWPELRFLFDYTKKGEKVLDLGCGNGRFSQYLEKADYTGVDFSEKMIEEARKRFPQKKFQVANALSLPFKANTFDKIYSVAVIHQVPSFSYRLEAISEARRVLKPGGLLFLTVWNIWEEDKMMCIKQALLNLFSFNSFGTRDIILKRDRYYYVFKKGELSHLVEKAGFSMEEEGVVKNKKHSNFYVVARRPSL